MKKINIITAIANPLLNNKLREYEDFNLIGQDIQYQEAIFEILDVNKEKEINYIILSEFLPGEFNIQEIVDKIKIIYKKINIIVILENKNEQLENILYVKGVFKVLYNNQIEIKEIINLINKKEKNSNQDLKEEIENLKKIIIENKIENKNEKEKNIKIEKEFFIKRIIKKDLKREKEIRQEIISISGPNGVGKSIITVNLAKAMSYEKKKILIIDFDILNNSLHTILGVKKYPEIIKKEINIEKEINSIITTINKRIHLISATELLFNSNNKLDIIKFQKLLNELKEKYNVIIIDTSSECFFDYTKNIIKLSNKNIFVIEANILEIKKAKKLLEIYINEWKIDKNKFNLLFNKYTKESINLNILKKIFFEFNIIGTLRYNQKYNNLINKNIKNNLLDKNIRQDYFNIKNNIK